MGSNTSKYGKTLRFVITLFIVSLIVIPGGILIYKSQEKKTINSIHIDLEAISLLKVEEIATWRMERMRDAMIISNDVLLNKQLSSFFSKEDPIIYQELVQWMKSLVKNYDYQSISLLDSNNNIRVAYPPLDSKLINPLSNHTSEVLNSGNIIVVDLHTLDTIDGIHMHIVIPLLSNNDHGTTIIGTAILTINPEIALFPLIQSWPTASKSSETMLIKREGDSIICQNEMRHHQNSALKLKFPVENEFIPVSGIEFGGIYKGLDYRGIPVISFIKWIPDSSWYLILKIDKSEAYTALREHMITISIIGLLVITALAVTIEYFREKENELKLSELNSTKDKFFSIISHDLKSPFTSIMGFSELLIEKAQSKDLTGTEEYATIIHNSSRNVMDLLTNLTVWSRIQTGKMIFNRRDVDIILIFDEVINLLSASALQKDITIIKDTPQQLNIQADPDMFSTIVRNLISNSIKFSHPGGKIVITTIQKENLVIIEVRDYGIGIKKEVLSTLFRIDECISTAGTQAEEGTGLGLILCKEFVTKHGGELWVESEENRGSRFFFTLPKTV